MDGWSEYELREAKLVKAERLLFTRVGALAFDALRVNALNQRKKWFAIDRGQSLLLRRAFRTWATFVSESKAEAAARRRQRREMKRLRIEEAEQLYEKQRKVREEGLVLFVSMWSVTIRW